MMVDYGSPYSALLQIAPKARQRALAQLHWQATQAIAVQDDTKAVACLANIAVLADSLGDERTLAYALCEQSAAQERLGQIEAALRTYESLWALVAHSTQSAIIITHRRTRKYVINAFAAHVDLARVQPNIASEEVEQIIEQRLDWLERINQVPQGHRLRLIRGQLWLEQGRTEDSLFELKQALFLRRYVPWDDDILPLSAYLEAIARPLCSLERWEEAESFCIELANEEGVPVPLRTWAWLQLGQIYANVEHSDEEVEQVVAQGLDWFERTDQVSQGHRLRLIRGQLWLERGRTEDALAELREALALRRRVPLDDIPLLSTYLEAIARPLCSLERWEEAEPFCIELANEEGVPIPVRTWAWVQLGQIYANTEHPDDEVEQIVAQGLAWFERTGQVPQGHRLRLIRGQLWLEQGRTEDALAELGEAVELRRSVPSDDIPPLSTYLEAIARPLCSLERWEEAEPFCIELANEEGAPIPVRTWAWVQLGQIYADIEHPDEEVEQIVAQGLAWFERTDQVSQGHRLRLIRGQLWLEQGRTEDALAELGEAVELRRSVPSDDIPPLSTYLEAIARPLCSLERWEEAEPFCIELADEESASVSARSWAWAQLAQIYIDTKRPAEGERAAQQALALGDLDPHSWRGTLIVLARIWLERGYAVLQTSPQEISSRERHERVTNAHSETLRWLDEATAVADVTDDGKIGQLQEKANTLIEQLFALQQKEPRPGVAPGEVWRIFVSSTIKDLDAYRRAVFDRLQSIPHMQVLNLSMETMGSQPGSPQEVSLERVEACDLFIGLYAERYGYIPPGSDRSITEQEFDQAHEWRKRCLCYLAALSAEFPTDSIEVDKGKIAALEAFKGRISEALVSAERFTGPDHLASLVVTDILKLLDGLSLGIDPGDFRTRCASAAERRATWLWQDLRGSLDTAVASPLEKVWGDFVSQPPWHERMRACSEQCRGRLEGLIKEMGDEVPDWLEKLHQQFRDLDYNANYVVLTRVLKKICAEDTCGQFSRLRWKSRDRPGLVNLCEEIEARLTHLARQVEFPLYQRCLLIRGGPGSGKTQFVFQLLDGGIWSGPYVPVLLCPPHDREENLNQLVLRELRQASGYGWRTLGEVNHFLERHDLRMVLIVDGLQRRVDTVPNFVAQLRKLIAEHSEWHSLHWLVTARDRSLQPFRGGRRFWLEYGVRGFDQWWQQALEPVPPPSDERRKVWLEQMEQTEMPESEVPHVGGWISLDDLNREDEVGLTIVNVQTERAINFALMEASSRRHVCVPFIAWIVVDLICTGAIQPGALRNLNFISFVKRFWNLKREQVERMPRGEETFLWMEQVVAWIADYCVQHNTSKEMRARLLDTIVKQATGRSAELTDPIRADRVLTALELENLLEWFRALHTDGIPVKFERLKFDTFWQYHLARQLYRRPALQNQDLEAVRELLRRYFPTEHEPGLGLQEGMLEFLFLILDDAGVRREFVDELVEFALHLLPAWRQAIWYAGTKGSVQFQKAVMAWAVDHGDEVAGEQDLFALLYFLRELEDSDIALTTRFRLLSPHYGTIAEYGLEALFWDLTQQWFAQPFETDDIVRSLIHLHGTEQMDLGEGVARVSFVALKEHAEAKADPSTQMLDWMVSLLTNVKNQIDWPPPPRPWWRARYLEWLLCDFCQWFVGREELKAYYMLDEWDWFESHKWWPLGLSMEREANIALGYVCRKYFSNVEREEYVSIISDLLRSKEKGKVIRAFYMTWHANWRRPLFRDVRERMQTESHLESRRNDPQYEEFFS